jgi:hypothetical protein
MSSRAHEAGTVKSVTFHLQSDIEQVFIYLAHSIIGNATMGHDERDATIRARRLTLWNPPVLLQGSTHEECERRASWIELFCNLVYAAAAIQLGA